MIEGIFICGAIALFAHLGKESSISPVIWGIISLVVYIIGASITYNMMLPSLIGGILSQVALFLGLSAYWILKPRKATADLQKSDDYIYIK